MRNLPPADELAQIRDDMRRLKIREAVLRRIVLDDPAMREGIDARVVVRVQKRLMLDPAQLPDFIRNDRRYWAMAETHVVLIENRGSATAPSCADGVRFSAPVRPVPGYGWTVPAMAGVTAPL
jgi:DNA-directed RNA polymerase subunit H (RpoH/RPB5)